MKKIITVLFVLLLAVGCQSKNNDKKVEEILEKLYVSSYEWINDIYLDNLSIEEYTINCNKKIENELNDDFVEDKLDQYISKKIFFNLNENAIKNQTTIKLKDIELEETGNQQYSYIIKLEFTNNNQTNETQSKGSIRFEDDKITYWIINSYPEYSFEND